MARALILLSLLCAAPRAIADPPARLIAVGDVALVDPVGSLLRSGRGDFFSAVRSTLSGADLAFANLECVLSPRPEPRSARGVTLRAPCEGAQALAAAGVDIVSMANNHAFDLGARGSQDSLGCVLDAGLHSVGIANNPASAQRPFLAVIRGLRVGLLAFTFATNRRADRSMYVALISDDPARAVRALRPSVDVVLVSLHWGVEFTHTPTHSQTTLAHSLIDAGADAVIGHHPHVLQSVEVYHNRPIAYSLGNFVFGPQPPPRNMSAMLTLELRPGSTPIARATLTPVIAIGHHGLPTPALGANGDGTRALIRSSSARFATRFTQTSGLLEVALR